MRQSRPDLLRVAAAAAMILLAAPARAGDAYRSDFSGLPNGRADLAGWSLGEGRFTIQDGWLAVASGQSNPRATLGLRHDGDGTFRGTVRGAAFCHRTILQAGPYALEVNNQFGQLIILRQVAGQWKQRAAGDNYLDYARRQDQFELRLSRAGRRVCGYIDGKKLVEIDDAEPIPPGGTYALAGGWGTDVAWRDIRLDDKPDFSEWPREKLPTTAPADLAKVTWVRGLSADNIYFDKQEAGLQFRLASPRRARLLHLAYRLIDVRQAVVAESAEDVDLSDGREHTLSVRFTPPRRGCFKIALHAGEQQTAPQWVEDLGSFTVVSRELADRPGNAKSVFGGHIDGINLQWHATAARKLGVQWVRCHDMLQHTWWDRVQPGGPDQWKWGDATQATVDRNGFATLGEFLWTPKWASTRPDAAKPAAYPPANMDDFSRYVSQAVAHYGKSIRHWEVWNEPHYGGFWMGSPADYARLLETAYATAKKADPACTVIGGGGISLDRMDWANRMIASLAGRPMDAFSIHYLSADCAAPQVAQLRKLLAGRGLDVPIWNTEASVITTSFLDQHRRATAEPEARYHFRNACFELVRMYMENLANGVERVFYYELADPWRFGQFAKPRPPKRQIGRGMWDEGQMLKPIAAAHAALADVIEGQTFRRRITSGPSRAFIFAGPDVAAAVCYAEFDSFSRKETLRLPLPAGTRAADLTVVDFMDNPSPADVRESQLLLPLSREPVYVRCRGPAAEATLVGLFQRFPEGRTGAASAEDAASK